MSWPSRLADKGWARLVHEAGVHLAPGFHVLFPMLPTSLILPDNEFTVRIESHSQLKFRDALKANGFIFCSAVLTFRHRMLGRQWLREAGMFGRAGKEGLFLSHCYFHARRCFLFGRIRRYPLNSVKYAEAVDVYIPCRIIH